MIDKVNRQLCTGCKMCADLCVGKSIEFETDPYGFWYPKVDYGKCTRCGICVKQCPGIHVFRSGKCHEPVVYAAWLLDTQTRMKCTSGGIYYALAKKVLELGGAVAACQYQEDWKEAEHILVEQETGLEPTLGSKYFQSDTAGIYRKVKELLNRDRYVLFCGTPCQCAALQRFCGEDQPKLLTMDFICRGSNSPKVYRAFLEELENRYQSVVSGVQFKNKRSGWSSLGILVQFENGAEHYETKYHSDWMRGFIKHNLYMRPSCHSCQYREIPRVADFTVGDFWGVKELDEEELFRGVSVVLVNSNKAGVFFDLLKETVHSEERTLQDVMPGNVCLLHSPEKGIYAEAFFELLKTKPFSEAVCEACGMAPQER